jgi:hypothetical protein
MVLVYRVALGLAIQIGCMIYILLHGPQSIIRVYWPVYKVVNSWPCCRDPVLWVSSCFMVPVYRVYVFGLVQRSSSFYGVYCRSIRVYVVGLGTEIQLFLWGIMPFYKGICCRPWYRDPALSMGYNAVLWGYMEWPWFRDPALLLGIRPWVSSIMGIWC